MGAGAIRKDLFLQIDGSADGLTRASKAARSTLAELGDASADLQRVVAENFRKLGGDGLQQSARAMEAGFRRSLLAMRADVEQTIGQPITAGSIINRQVSGANDQLASTQATAAAYRDLANAQARLVAETPTLSAGQRELAVALEVQALKAEEDVGALEQQIGVLQSLRRALGSTADAEAELDGAHGRVGASGMIMQHVIRSTTDSFAAGLPVSMIFAEQLSRLGEAAALAGGEGAMGKFAAFMTGPWGFALQAAIAIAVTLGRTLIESGDAAKASAKAHDELKEALDRLAGAAATANHETRQGIIDDINAAAAARQHAAGEREKLAAKLASAKADLKANQGPGVGGYAVGSYGATIGNPTALADSFTAASLDKQLADNATKIQDLNKDILAGSAKLIVRDAAGASDPRTAANQRYEDAKDALQRRYEKGGLKPDAFRIQMATLDAAHEDDLDSLKKHHQKKPKADHTAERAADADRAYQAQVDQAQEAYARAQLGLSDTAQQRYDVEQQRLQDGLKQRLAEIDDMVTAKKIPGQTKAEIDANAEVLRNLAIKTEQLGQEKAKRDEMSALLDQQLAREKQSLDDKIAILQLERDLATGTKARRDLSLQILADEEAEARAEAQKVLHDQSSTPEQKYAAGEQLRQIDAEHPLKVDAINRQNQTPLQAYGQQLKANVGDMNDALQGVTVDGLKGVEDGLTGLLTGTESVKQAFKKMADSIIADLVRIAVEKLIVNSIGSFLGLKDGGAVPGFANGGLPRFDGGGKIHGPGTGRSDSILAIAAGKRAIRVSNGEYIINAASTRKYLPLIQAINDNSLGAYADGGMPVPQAASLSRGDMKAIYGRSGNDSGDGTLRVVKGDMFDVIMEGVAHKVVNERTPGIVGGAVGAVQDLSARRVINITTGA